MRVNEGVAESFELGVWADSVDFEIRDFNKNSGLAADTCQCRAY